MTKYFMGIDVSTTGSKAVVMDETGAIVARAGHNHPLSTPKPLWAEQDPEDWWSASQQSIREVLQQVNAADIGAIGLTGQMLGLTPMDKNGVPLRPAILWNDQRSGAECDAITEQIGEQRVFQITGSMMLPGMTVPKIIWMRNHEPELYKQIRHILLPKDYVRYKLSGALVTDVADGSGIGLMDVGTRLWSDEMLTELDVPKAWLPDLCESPEVCTTVSEEGAEATGLKAGTPIVGGAGDQSAQAVGSGIISAGATSLTVGTSGVLFTSADRYAPDKFGRVHTFCHAVPGYWTYMGVMQSAAGSLRWLHDALAADSEYDTLNEQVKQIPIGAAGLLFAPYLSGERHPHPDPLARGAFVGLTLRSELPHMVRSTMEGVAFGMRDLVELARAQGTNPADAAVSGGAANSPVWRQIMTDVMGFPLYTVNTTEGAAYGAAILAAVGGGAFDSVQSACQQIVKREDETRPQGDAVGRYEQLYQIYRKVYPALKEIFADLGAFEAAE